MSQIRILTVLAVIFVFATAESSAVSIANFWISQHGAPSVGSKQPMTWGDVPQINRLSGSGTGSFYIWAKSAPNENLVNWSLDVVSTNANAIKLTNSWVAPYNQTLNGITSGPDSERRWEYSDEPPAGSVGDIIKDINGFSLFSDEGKGIGIGTVNSSKSTPDPYYHAGSDSWLIARIDYVVGTTPNLPLSSEIYLQIGSRGMSHCSVSPCFVSSASDTSVVFGALSDSALKAGLNGPVQQGQRGLRSSTSEAVFTVKSEVVPQADFDRDGFINRPDLTIWKHAFGLASDGDADGDGDTDGRDFLIWQRQFNGSSSSETPGDFDSDGDVDGRDFLVWQRDPNVGSLADWQANYGVGTLTAYSTAVPESGTFILLAIGASSCPRIRKY
jgi:hypothetical protein